MKKSLLLLLLCGIALYCQDFTPLLERFDPGRAPSGQVLGHGGIAPGEGMESGALKAVATGKQESFYRNELNLKGGRSYALAFNYRTSPKLSNYLIYVKAIYRDASGAKIGAAFERRLTASEYWTHRRFTLEAPVGTVSALLELSLDARIPKDEYALFDFLRVAEIKDNIARGIDIGEFDTDFEIWEFDRYLVFDHFCLKAGGSIETEWRKAKFGETYFKAVGNGSPMQYSLMIENLKVSSLTNYAFTAWINSSAAFSMRTSNILIFFYKDKNFKDLGESRLYPASSKNVGEWREIVHSFTTPKDCEYLSIGLNMRNVSEKDELLLDRMRLARIADNAMLDFEIDPDKDVLSAKIIATGELRDGKNLSPAFVVRDSGGKEIKRFASKTLQLDIDLKAFPDGEYALEGLIKKPDGAEMSTGASKFGVYKNPSWRNELGVQNPEMTPPTPWRKLEWKDGKLQTWKPALRFNKGGMQLQSVEADGRSLLKAPVEFVCNGRELLSSFKQAKWDVKPSLATCTASLDNEDWLCNARLEVDYIGFLKYKLDFTAKRSSTIDKGKLLLDIANAEFLNRCDYSWSGVGSIVFSEQPEYSSRQMYSDLQMGDVDNGICVYLSRIYPAKREFDEPWLKANKDGRLELELIHSPLKLNQGESHTVEFALCPYPFRPDEQLWRRLFFRAGPRRNCDLVWGISMPMMKYSGSLLDVADEAAVRRHLEVPNRPQCYLIYQIPTYILDNMPQWKYFQKRWKSQLGTYYDMSKSHGGMLVAADYRDRDWQDLYCKSMADNLAKYNWDGIYYDCFSADWFSERGQIFSPVFECKAFQERIYNIQRLGRPASVTISHVGAAQASTLGMYSNVILMGEQYRGMLMKHAYYTEAMSLDCFRYENAVNMGPTRMFMPEYRKVEYIGDAKLTVHTAMLAILHNLMFYPHSVNGPIEQRVRCRKIDFGLEDVTFLPYWKDRAAKLLCASSDKVKISIYQKPNGDLLAAVFNNSKQPTEFRLEPQGKFANATWYDPLADSTLTWTQGAALKLEPYLGGLFTLRR
ncbi:MAG: hypothetical protein J5746_10600 [Victivallales bacterium]|nr:hypothetical protein [Victivallales bacterium]